MRALVVRRVDGPLIKVFGIIRDGYSDWQPLTEACGVRGLEAWSEVGFWGVGGIRPLVRGAMWCWSGGWMRIWSLGSRDSRAG
jgi:hypothetical protein